MMEQWLTILPPVLALALAVRTRNVYWALGGAIWVSEMLIAAGNPFTGLLSSIDRAVSVFESRYNTRVLLFCLIIGALIAYMQKSGGIAALVEKLVHSGAANTRKKAGLVTALTGSALFMDTNVSLLSTGIMGRPLFDHLKMSRERLAYIIDSTCAPISILILINGWGAYVLGLIGGYGFDDPVGLLAATIPLNFYALLTLSGVYLTVATDKVIGPMKHAETRVEIEVSEESIMPTKARFMAVPLLIVVLGTIGFMVWTGQGNIMEGAGAQSILWAVVLATGVSFLLLRLNGGYKSESLIKMGFEGVGDLLPAVTVIFLSLALASSLSALGTGAFMASMAEGFPVPALLPAILFILAGVTSFATGTSWGTYGILVPIALPIAIGANIPPELVLAAVMGGGVFGDHCSPISDTSIIASFAAGTDHISHVQTQLPYALIGALGAALLYIVAGFLMV
jgi:Na+/H+ antiporter NhaC